MTTLGLVLSALAVLVLLSWLFLPWDRWIVEKKLVLPLAWSFVPEPFQARHQNALLVHLFTLEKNHTGDTEAAPRGMSNMALVYAIYRLAEKGFVSQERVPWRGSFQSKVTLTEAGRQIAEKLAQPNETP